MKSKTINEYINGNPYVVKTREWFWGKTVKVTDSGDILGEHRTTYAVRRDWFNLSGKTIEQLIQETLNDAVCKREDKIDEKEEYSQRINRAVAEVKEAHEN